MIIIPHKIYLSLIDHCKSGLPYEICGFFAGKAEGSVKYVEKIYFLKNTDNSPYHFSVDPKEQIAANRNMRSRKMKLIALWHSHPDTKACLSDEDIRLAYDKTISYVIISLKEETPRIRAFKFVYK